MHTATTAPSIETAYRFDLSPVVSRYQREYDMNAATADVHARELKRYLFLCAKYPGARWPMVKSIDGLWHTFLLFSRRYSEFCAQLGTPYIHHEPMSGAEDKNEVDSAYEEFLQRYQEHFGVAPTDIWPASLSPHTADSECGGGDCESNCVQCR